MEEKKKCSNKEHEKIDAIFFCSECKIYLCNKCENFHSNLFKNHNCYNLDKDKNEIYWEYCQEKEHNNSPLEFFCKAHNQLCCGFCICKLKEKGKGQHKDCNVCIIEDIKEEKKNSLKNNIQNLEKLSKNIEETINKYKDIYENLNKKKEDLKLEILNIFTKIRNCLNERENELLSDIDTKFELIQINENNIKSIEKLPNTIKNCLEKGRKMENELNENINVNSIIMNCINIEQTIKQINTLNEAVQKNENKKFELKFIYLNEFDDIKDAINKFGIIHKQGSNTLIKLDDSSIIKDNNLVIFGLNNWKENIKTQLLYKKSRDGNDFNTFHNLCDNKGKTLTLIQSSEGFIIGGYTPLEWNRNSGWKNDNDTFLFSITNKRIYKKKDNNTFSIYCGEDQGPWFPLIGFRETGKKNMSQGQFLYKENPGDTYFEGINEIIPNENKDRFFNVKEVEVYKLTFNN